jgi:hypothetical protein
LKTLLTKENINGWYIKKPLSKNTDWRYWTTSLFINFYAYNWNINFYCGGIMKMTIDLSVVFVNNLEKEKNDYFTYK